jgi:chromosome segregation ATPase
MERQRQSAETVKQSIISSHKSDLRRLESEWEAKNEEAMSRLKRDYREATSSRDSFRSKYKESREWLNRAMRLLKQCNDRIHAVKSQCLLDIEKSQSDARVVYEAVGQLGVAKVAAERDAQRARAERDAAVASGRQGAAEASAALAESLSKATEQAVALSRVEAELSASRAHAAELAEQLARRDAELRMLEEQASRSAQEAAEAAARRVAEAERQVRDKGMAADQELREARREAAEARAASQAAEKRAAEAEERAKAEAAQREIAAREAKAMAARAAAATDEASRARAELAQNDRAAREAMNERKAALGDASRLQFDLDSAVVRAESLEKQIASLRAEQERASLEHKQQLEDLQEAHLRKLAQARGEAEAQVKEAKKRLGADSEAAEKERERAREAETKLREAREDAARRRQAEEDAKREAREAAGRAERAEAALSAASTAQQQLERRCRDLQAAADSAGAEVDARDVAALEEMEKHVLRLSGLVRVREAEISGLKQTVQIECNERITLQQEINQLRREIAERTARAASTPALPPTSPPYNPRASSSGDNDSSSSSARAKENLKLPSVRGPQKAWAQTPKAK